MPIIDWNYDKYNVGIHEIDEQHEGLFKILNELYDSFKFNEAGELLDETFKKLLDYAGKHFKTEEDIMEKYGYPESKSHKEIHDTFVNKVKEKYKEYSELRDDLKETKIATDVILFINDWIIDHILYTDKKYCKYFKQNDVDVT